MMRSNLPRSASSTMDSAGWPTASILAASTPDSLSFATASSSSRPCSSTSPLMMGPALRGPDAWSGTTLMTVTSASPRCAICAARVSACPAGSEPSYATRTFIAPPHRGRRDCSLGHEPCGGGSAGRGGRFGRRGRGQVQLPHVVAHHSRREQLRGELTERPANHPEPGAGEAVVAVVEARGELALDQVEDGGRLARIACLCAEGVPVGRRDCPPERRGVALVPPAIQDREVEHAVERRLHAARAAGLEWAQWRVEPHVHAGD